MGSSAPRWLVDAVGYMYHNAMYHRGWRYLRSPIKHSVTRAHTMNGDTENSLVYSCLPLLPIIPTPASRLWIRLRFDIQYVSMIIVPLSIS